MCGWLPVGWYVGGAQQPTDKEQRVRRPWKAVSPTTPARAEKKEAFNPFPELIFVWGMNQAVGPSLAALITLVSPSKPKIVEVHIGNDSLDPCVPSREFSGIDHDWPGRKEPTRMERNRKEQCSSRFSFWAPSRSFFARPLPLQSYILQTDDFRGLGGGGGL